MPARPTTSGTHQTQTLCDEPWAAAVRPPATTEAATSRIQRSVAAGISATASTGHG